MSGAAGSYEPYQASRGQEWSFRVGPATGTPILFVPPLLEEMNRCRALMIATMRELAGYGHCAWLPDLSATGESLLDLTEIGWDDWREDVRRAAEHVRQAHGRPPIAAAIRGGCLLDDAAGVSARWRFAPVTGASLARDLDRAALGGGAEWAGYHDASPALRAAVAAAQPAMLGTLRLTRLATDVAPADAKFDGPALWRRSEPGASASLATALARDIHDWSVACAGS